MSHAHHTPTFGPPYLYPPPTKTVLVPHMGTDSGGLPLETAAPLYRWHRGILIGSTLVRTARATPSASRLTGLNTAEQQPCPGSQPLHQPLLSRLALNMELNTGEIGNSGNGKIPSAAQGLMSSTAATAKGGSCATVDAPIIVTINHSLNLIFTVTCLC